MKQAQFIQVLQQEFEGHPLRDRFLAELQDHMEDLDEDPSQSFDENRVEEKMGDPQKIKPQFIAIVDPCRKVFFVTESMTIAFALVVLTTAFYSSFIAFIYGLGSFWLPFLAFPLAFLFLFQIIFIRYSEIKPLTQLKEWLWILIAILPSLATFLGMVFLGSLSTIFEWGDFLKVVLFYLLGTGVILFLARWIGRNRPRVYFVARLPHWLYFVALFIVLARVLLTYLPLQWVVDHSFLRWIFSPLFLFDQGFNVAWKNIDSGPFFGLYLPILIVSFIIIYSVIFSIRLKRWTTDRGLVLLYFGSLLLVNPMAFIEPPRFELPSMHVSKALEKSQLSVIYPYFKYASLNKGWSFVSQGVLTPQKNSLFTYNVEPFKEAGFVIKNNLGQHFHFTTNSTFTWGNVSTLPFTREFLYDDSDFKIHTDASDSFLRKGVPYSIRDMAQSQDQKWWLVVVSHEALASDEIYLLKNSD